MSSHITPAVKSAPRATLRLAAAARIKPPAAATVMSLLGLAAGLLVFRRLAGALDDPLSTAHMAIAACGFAAASSAFRLLNKSDFEKHASIRSRLGRLILVAAPSAFVIAAGISLSLPGSPAAGLALLWTIIAAGEIGFFARAFFSLPACPHHPLENMQEPDAEITQQIVRRQGPDGVETMTGVLRAAFLAGQRTATVHVAFCPPFSALPTLEVAQIDGPPSRVKTVQLLPYGVRFDIKLSADSPEPQTVCLRFEARVGDDSATPILS